MERHEIVLIFDIEFHGIDRNLAGPQRSHVGDAARQVVKWRGSAGSDAGRALIRFSTWAFTSRPSMANALPFTWRH
jgi:hypothetical protein